MRISRPSQTNWLLAIILLAFITLALAETNSSSSAQPLINTFDAVQLGNSLTTFSNQMQSEVNRIKEVTLFLEKGAATVRDPQKQAELLSLGKTILEAILRQIVWVVLGLIIISGSGYLGYMYCTRWRRQVVNETPYVQSQHSSSVQLDSVSDRRSEPTI